MNHTLRRLCPALVLLTFAASSHAQGFFPDGTPVPPPPLAAGTRAPSIVTPTLNGHGTVNLSALRGRVVLVDFWATWCQPCQMATPTLQYLHKTYGHKGLTVLGMNVDQPDTQKNIRPFLSHFHMTYPVAVLSRANVQSAMAYHVDGIPSQYLIDKHGVVRWSQGYYDPAEGPMLFALIQKLLAEKG